MLTLSHACPRCAHEKSILTIVWAEGVDMQAYMGRRETVVRCVHCLMHSIVVFVAPGDFRFTGDQNVKGDISAWPEIAIAEVLPAVEAAKAPDDVPERIAKAFTDGKSILARGMWTPAAGSFRTSLDRATQLLWAGLAVDEEMPFKMDRRLKKLAEKLFIPASMMEWADTVRVVGNEMHDIEDVTKEDAEDAAHFVETFLTYMFTLPARVARFKARREAE